MTMTTKRGSFDLVTFESVINSPSNKKYSFSKGERFPSVRRTNHDQIGYTLPSTKKQRAAGFGIGERFKQKSNGKFKQLFHFLGKSKSPSPDRYNIPSLFNPNVSTSTFAVHCKGSRTFAFGTGREAFSKTVINPENLGADSRNPGPGTYQPLHPLGKDAVAFKLKFKLDYGDTATEAKKRNIPAPGTYDDVLQLDAKGRYSSS
jgi:hypothetical protein